VPRRTALHPELAVGRLAQAWSELAEFVPGVRATRTAHSDVLPLDLKPHQSLQISIERESSALLPPTLASDRARERDDVDRPGACTPELSSRRGRRSPGRIDVVNENDCRRSVGTGPEAPSSVRPPQPAVEASLAPRRPRAGEERLDRQPPPAAEADGERLGRVLTAPESSVRVARDEGDDGGARARHDPGDELGRGLGEPAEPALLPACDNASCGAFVGDRATGAPK